MHEIETSWKGVGLGLAAALLVATASGCAVKLNGKSYGIGSGSGTSSTEPAREAAASEEAPDGEGAGESAAAPGGDGAVEHGRGTPEIPSAAELNKAIAGAKSSSDKQRLADSWTSRADALLDHDDCKYGSTCEERLRGALTLLDAAFRVQPGVERAGRVCAITKNQSNNIPPFIAGGWDGPWATIASRCDYVADHGDENKAGSFADASRALFHRVEQAMGEEAAASRRASAARALFGDGLTVRVDEGKGTIAIDWGDELDARTYQGYIRDYYRAPIFAARARPAQFGAALLRDPAAKAWLCQEVASEQGSWCSRKGAIEARRSIFGFAGKAVSWNARSSEDVGIADSTKFLVVDEAGHYAAAITVAGPRNVDDWDHVQRLRLYMSQQGGRAVGEDAARVQRLVDEAEALDKEKKRGREKAYARLAGKRGRVMFSTRSFNNWTPPEYQQTGHFDSCRDIYWGVVAPRGGQSYEAQLRVNGKKCAVLGLSPGRVEALDAAILVGREMGGTFVSGMCEALATPGQHTLESIILSERDVETGDLYLDRDLTIRKDYETRQKKTGVMARVTCGKPLSDD